MSDFNCQTEEIEVYESSSHEERKKPFQDTEKNEHFLYILLLQIMPTMRQKKKKSTFKLFHPQNKDDRESQLANKKSDFEVERIVGFGLNGKNIFDVPSKEELDYRLLI